MGACMALVFIATITNEHRPRHVHASMAIANWSTTKELTLRALYDLQPHLLSTRMLKLRNRWTAGNMHGTRVMATQNGRGTLPLVVGWTSAP